MPDADLAVERAAAKETAEAVEETVDEVQEELVPGEDEDARGSADGDDGR